MSKRKVGRPLIEIDWKEFDKLCELQCTQEEIASFFDCSVDTIDRAVKRTHHVNFAEYFAQKRQKGKISLRRKLWEMANKNVTMQIWLSKQHLGFTDKVEEKIEATIHQDIVYKAAWGRTEESSDGNA